MSGATEPAGDAAIAGQPMAPGAAGGRGALASWLTLAAAVVVLDQTTKQMVEGSFAFAERRAVVPGWFDLTLVYNKGAAFSFLAAQSGWQRWFFMAVAAVASALIAWMLVRHANQRVFAAGLAFILGGAVGNLIDRVLHGHVIDFLLAHWDERWFFPAFNVADAAITLGAALLILDELRRMLRRG